MDYRALKGMSLDSLRELNNAVISEIRLRDAEKQQNAARQFRIGGRAKFLHQGRIITMEIDRFNHKTVSGREVGPDGQPMKYKQWRVTPTLLQPA